MRNYTNFNDVLTLVDEDGMTLLHLATLGLTNIFSSVCTNLSYINCTAFKCPYKNGFQKYNREEPYFKTIKLLTTKVAPQHINKKDKHGRTALHYSIILRSPRIFKQLIRKGSDWKIKDKNGNTALKFALKRSLEFANLGRCFSVFYALFNASKITISDENHVYCLNTTALVSSSSNGISDFILNSIKIAEKIVHNNLPSSWYTLLSINLCIHYRFITYAAVDHEIKRNEELQDLLFELVKMFKPDVEVKCEVPGVYSIWHVLALNSTGRWTLKNDSSLQSFVDTPMGFSILNEQYDTLGYLPIHVAALNKNIDRIDWFINNGGNIWKKTTDGWTSLHLLLIGGHCPPPELDKLLSNITSNPVYNFSSGYDFWCNTTSAPLSLLHIAAQNFNCLKYIQNNSFIPMPYLPFPSCSNTHGITLLYLIHLNNGVLRKLTTAEWKDFGLATDETILTYPERKAEYHLIYNTIFSRTPDIDANLKSEVNSLHLFRLPGISDLLPYAHVIEGQITRCNDRCGNSTFHAYRSFISVFPTALIMNDTFDSRSDGFIDIVQQMAKMRYHCIKRFYKVNATLWRQVLKAYSCSYKCRCLEIKRLLQKEFIEKNLESIGNVTRFIEERMGWNVTSVTSAYFVKLYRWPFDFLLKKALKMDKDYDYLKMLSV